MAVQVRLSTSAPTIRANTAALAATASGVAQRATSLKTTPVVQDYIHNLMDVVETDLVSGATLVYNANTNKYEIKPIEISNQILDGGTF
jgi:hypothetical protein